MMRKPFHLFFIASIFLFYIASGCSPEITGIDPPEAAPGEEVLITGEDFNFNQGESSVTFNGVDAGLASEWGNHAIRIIVPSEATSGPVVVTVQGNASNPFPFVVHPAGYCEGDPDCDDGLWCNGAETCVEFQCQGGTPACSDDGLFCNGTEGCDEENDSCTHTGDPCDDLEPCTADSCSEDELCRHTCIAVGLGDRCCADPACAGEPVCAGHTVAIPGGCFDMGDHFWEGYGDELPVHNVCISAFEMDVHEVTNAEYEVCVAAGRCTAPEYTPSDSRPTYYGDPAYDDFPVIWVNWYQAEAYCTWAGKRLPTEAEWEYAARGGLSGKRYPWGDTISGGDANYRDSGDPWDNDTSRVEYYAPNGYGLYDMAGNVFEWVNDWYQSDYYRVSPPDNPPGPASGTYRVLRGGSWSNSSTNTLRVAFRTSWDPSWDYSVIGFRCAR